MILYIVALHLSSVPFRGYFSTYRIIAKKELLVQWYTFAPPAIYAKVNGREEKHHDCSPRSSMVYMFPESQK